MRKPYKIIELTSFYGESKENLSYPNFTYYSSCHVSSQRSPRSWSNCHGNSGKPPGAVAYDSAKGEIFVANEGVVAGTSTVSVISDSNNTAVATIPVGEETLSRAGAIAYDSGKGEIFVTLETATGTNPSSLVSVISDSTNAVVANINVGNDPDGIAMILEKAKYS